MGTNIADWFSSSKRGAFEYDKAWSQLCICRWSKTAVILMFISPVALFSLN
jgi:hypothetical protein